ncbi:MAG: ComF family protein [Luteolibacter sp.]
MNPLDWIYPSVCAICEEGLPGNKALCDSCKEGMPRIVRPFCDVCGESFQGQIEGAFDCPNCREVSFHFEFARAAMDRSDEMLQLVHGLKYGRQLHLVKDLGKLACEAFSDKRLELVLEERWPLVPVPLHWVRQRGRHFNQAEEIARVVSQVTGLPVERRLKRGRRTITQTRLSRRERMANLKNAFQMRGKGFFGGWDVPPGVVLVDDVFTTGSTVDACAKVLRKAGVERVAVLTVMRG